MDTRWLRGIAALLLGVAFLWMTGVARAQKPGKPPTPTGLSATSSAVREITLAWNPSSGATKYNVKRLSGRKYVTLASPTTPGYVDRSVQAGQVCQYVVSAVNSAGESANSASVQALALAPLVGDPAIVYVTGGKIMVMDADGSNPTPVALGSGYPNWSPDGQKIAFDDGNAIWVLNRDGTGRVKVADANLPDDGAMAVAWSPVPAPDGRHKIAFSDGSDIWVVNPDGTGRRQLTATPQVLDTGEWEFDCSWSPDATRLVVATTTYRTVVSSGDPVSNDRLVILTLGTDGGGGLIVAGRTVLQEDPTGRTTFIAPDWSRGGAPGDVAYERLYETHTEKPDGTVVITWDFSVWTVEVATGAVAQQIAPDMAGYQEHPSWSPDDSQLVFSDYGTIYRIDVGVPGATPVPIGSGYSAHWRRNP